MNGDTVVGPEVVAFGTAVVSVVGIVAAVVVVLIVGGVVALVGDDGKVPVTVAVTIFLRVEDGVSVTARLVDHVSGPSLVDNVSDSEMDTDAVCSSVALATRVQLG